MVKIASPSAILATAKAARTTPHQQGSGVLAIPGGNATYGGIYAANTMLPRPPEDFTEGAFTPLNPIYPYPINQPPPGLERPRPRRRAYQVGENLPGAGQRTQFGTLSFESLRGLSRGYSVARACIKLLKSEIRGLQWDVVPTKDAAKAMRGDHTAMTDFGERRAKVIRFFENPDPEYGSWNSWIDTLLEDVYAIDALSVYLRPSRLRGRGLLGSDLSALELIDGSTIRPLVDVSGSRPSPPSPGYQQYIFGVPRTDNMSIMMGADLAAGADAAMVQRYRGDQLLYLPFERQTNSPYGFPPIEQALVPITNGLAKQAYQSAYFNESSIPQVYISPGDQSITAAQVKELQEAFNIISGDLGYKFKVVVLPPGSKPFPMKDPILADQFDAIVMQEVAMAFMIQPTELGLMPQVATVQTPSAVNMANKSSNAIHQRKSLVPMLQFLKENLLDKVIQVVCRQADMQFMFDGLEEDEDEATLTNLIIAQIGAGLCSVDEGRAEIGRDPWGLEVTQDPLWASANGVMLLGSVDPATGQPAGTPAALPSVGQQMSGAIGGSSPGANQGQVNPRPALAQGHMPGTTHVPPAQADRKPTPAHAAAVAGAREAAARTAASSSKAASLPDALSLHRYLAVVPGDPSACKVCDSPRSYPVHAITAVNARKMLAGAHEAAYVITDLITAPDLASLGKAAAEVLAPAPVLALPAPPASDKAVLSELDALSRHIRKGRDPRTWQPVHIPGALMAGITEDLEKGLDAADVLTEAAASLPKAASPEPVPGWLAWEHDEQLAGKYAAQIAAAFAQVQREAADLFGQYLAGTLPVTAQTLASMIGDLIRDRLALILGPLHSQGFALGFASAAQAAGMPGQRQAAQQMSTAQLARQAAIRQMAATGLAAFAAALVAAVLAGGATVASLLALLAGFLSADRRADLIALSELLRAIGEGVLAAYLELGVTHCRWASVPDARRCAKCKANTDAGVLPLGSVWPGTRTVAPPGHPGGCRCALLPEPPPGVLGKISAGQAGVSPAGLDAAAPRLIGPVRDLAKDPVATKTGSDARPAAAPVQLPSADQVTKADKPWKHPDELLPVADRVFAQLAEDYPPGAIQWVKRAKWSGPEDVPLDAIEYQPSKWQAGHEPAKVERFRRKIAHRQKTGKPVKPVILCDRPDTERGTHLYVVDGHHRTMAWHELNRPVWGYVGIVSEKDTLAAMETHSSQLKEGDPGASDTAASKSFTAGSLGDGSVHGLVPSGLRGQAHGYDLNSRSGMISLDIPDGVIEPVPGGVSDHHITVVYLGPDVDDEAFARACGRAREAAEAMPAPLGAILAGIDSFEASGSSDGKVPAFVPAMLTSGDDLRAGLEDLSASEHAGWKPHVTLAYLDEGQPLPDPLPPVPVTFTHLSVHRGDDVQRFPFGGSAAKSAATPYLSTVHRPLGHEGLWHTPDRHVATIQQLPAYFQSVARALMRDHGLEESHAIAEAVNAVKEWAEGHAFGGKVKVTPTVQAAAQRAVAEWEHLRATHAG